MVEPVIDKYESNPDTTQSMYYSAYGKPPILTWYPNREHQRTVENRIIKLVRRHKAFYLNTISLHGNQEETWYVDGGNWASANEKLIGHVKNCLEFLEGRKPMWYKGESA